MNKYPLYKIIMLLFLINLVAGYYDCHEFGSEKCDDAWESQCVCFCSSHIPTVAGKNFTFLDMNIICHNLNEINNNSHKNLFLKSIEHPPRIILS